MKSGIFKFAAFAICIALRTSVALAWGEHTIIRNIETQTMLIRHTATEFQRRTAENNAKTFFGRLPQPKKLELRKKNIQSVLIRTAPGPQTSPKAEVRMRFSLEGNLIDNGAYEFPTPLQAGTIANIKGLDPEYVGQ